jgi:hypothetical protein
MRSIVFAAALITSATSVAQAQQAQPLAPKNAATAQSQPAYVAGSVVARNVAIVDAPIGITRSQARAHAVQSNQVTTTGAASMDPNTKNTLAIVGAVVIIIALVALLL